MNQMNTEEGKELVNIFITIHKIINYKILVLINTKVLIISNKLAIQ